MNKFQKAIYQMAKTSFKAIKRNSNTGDDYTFARHYKMIKVFKSLDEFRTLEQIKEKYKWYKSQLKFKED